MNTRREVTHLSTLSPAPAQRRALMAKHSRTSVTPVPRRLPQADVDALCVAARHAWDAAPGHARQARFVWRGKPFVATHGFFTLYVKKPDGTPVAYAYD
jgi:hypothetical protein